MKRLFFFLFFCSTLLPGCSYFGYYKYEKAVRAPPSLAEKVQFPDSYKGGIHTDGRLTRALAVAMNDYLPPGAKLTGDNQHVAQCLSRWDTYDIYIQRASDDLFFIYFFPILARCGLDDSLIMDAGAEYAVDGEGRILEVH
ncbi:MAG: hypothetical protein ACJ8AT_19435 [Hyalangium sp.]|uniref:hypothetical protein n=1 Tax=Hyalangium sp. TaxID=2028555 RepID=UPI003899F985